MQDNGSVVTSEREPHSIARVLLVDWTLRAGLWMFLGLGLCFTVIGIWPGALCLRRMMRIIHQGNLDILSHGKTNRLARTTPVGRALGYKDVE